MRVAAIFAFARFSLAIPDAKCFSLVGVDASSSGSSAASRSSERAEVPAGDNDAVRNRRLPVGDASDAMRNRRLPGDAGGICKVLFDLPFASATKWSMLLDFRERQRRDWSLPSIKKGRSTSA